MSKTRAKAHHRAVLTVADVKAIVKARNAKKPVSVAELAAKYDVTTKTIYNILSGYTWSEVTGIPRQEKAAA